MGFSQDLKIEKRAHSSILEGDDDSVTSILLSRSDLYSL